MMSKSWVFHSVGAGYDTYMLAEIINEHTFYELGGTL